MSNPGLLCAIIAVLDEGRILMTKREDFEVWCLPGGVVEAHESLAEAAVRETREETGLGVRLLRLVGTYSRPRLGLYHTAALFAAEVVGGSLQPQPSEVIAMDFFAADALPEPMIWGTRQMALDALSGASGLVSTTDMVRPADWPPDRQALYAARDRSGLPRQDFYVQYIAALGPDTIRRELGEDEE